MIGINLSEIYLLPTDQKVTIIGRYKDTGALTYNDFTNDIPRGESCHIYVTKNERINVGDWFYNGLHNIIQQCKDGLEAHSVNHFPEYAKKIIATTDKSIFCNYDNYPQPTVDFIKYFINELNKNTPVEYGFIEQVFVQYEFTNSLWKLCVDSNNEIIIGKMLWEMSN